jgi:hypothetical protein
LNIQKVTVGDDSDKDAAFDLKSKQAVMGSALHIHLPSGLKEGASITVKVLYKTTTECTALQWLNKELAHVQFFHWDDTHLLQANSGEEISVSLQPMSGDLRTVSCPTSR